MGRNFRCVLIILVAAASAWAQDLATVERQVEGLRGQLQEVSDKETALRERVQKLDEDLETQNVERSVSTVGTTDVKALRDQRREQLQREKAQVEGQLTSLSSSRSRLESAIATAEAEAVRLRAAALAPTPTPTIPPKQEPAATPPAPAVKKQPSAPRRVRRVRRSPPRRRATPR